MTATKTDPRVATRLAELTAKLDALPKDGALPIIMTRDEHRAIITQRAKFAAQIASITHAASSLAAIDVEPDTRWRDFLVPSRLTCCDELMAIKSPIRDADSKAKAQSLTFSLKMIDFGLNASAHPVVSFAPTRIGELMTAAGYAVSGPELRGPRGWQGSLPEVERRLADLTRRKAAALAALDEALMSDEELKQRDAEQAALRTLRLKRSADGRSLVAVRPDGSPLPVSEMSELQRAAFKRQEARELDQLVTV